MKTKYFEVVFTDENYFTEWRLESFNQSLKENFRLVKTNLGILTKSFTTNTNMSNLILRF